MALPFVQVKDLAPSASFYSAVSQPLGLRFVSAGPSSIVFGNPNPTFEVKASADAPRPTRIVLSASSPSVVSAFHAAARRAHPKGISHIALKEDDGSGAESRASATDLEGNVVEIVYAPPRGGQTQPTAKQVTRVLGWNLNVATSTVGAARSTVGAAQSTVGAARSTVGAARSTVGAARSTVGSAAPSRPGLATLISGDGDESYRIIRRSFTSSTVETSPPPQQQESKGLSTGAMVGTVLGAVAAGAAIGAGLSYAFSKRERERAPRQEFEAPPFQRRATYPEPYTDQQQQPRYVEMERTVEKVRYPEQYPPGSNKYAHPAHPAYTTRQPQASPPAEEIVEERPIPIRDSPSSRARERSVESPRKPLMITEVEHRSNVSTRVPEPPRVVEVDPRSQVESTKPPNPKSQLHAELFKRRSPVKAVSSNSIAPDARSHVSSRSRRDDSSRSHVGSRHKTVRPDPETYVSARTEKSNTTARPPKSSSRSKAPTRAPSYVSAREIPTPPKDDWEDLADDIDDKASVAPSDSISCVGDRPKPHERDLPFLQTRERIIIQ